MYGRTYLGNERTTFIIDPAGKIACVCRTLTVSIRAAPQVRQGLERLPKGPRRLFNDRYIQRP
jgi:peroxiredoxin